MPRTCSWATLWVVLALGSGCYFEIEPIDLPSDLGVPDLLEDASGRDLGDGPRCPGGGAPFHVGELTEAPIERWGAEALEPLNASPPTTTVVLDPARVVAGAASLRLDTRNGQAALLYPKTRDGGFDLRKYLYLSFSITADNSAPTSDPGWQGAQPHVLLVTDSKSYIELVPTTNRIARTPGTFDRVTVPIAGGNGWSRNLTGEPDLGKVRYLAFTFDSWGQGFTVWLDDLQIGPGEFLDCAP